MRILLSKQASGELTPRITALLDPHPFQIFFAEDCQPGDDIEVAFISRDVTGLSTKQVVLPSTQHFYDLLLNAPSLAWVHTHSAGSDRPIFAQLREKNVAVTTSNGVNAEIVVQSALAAILSLARHFPAMQLAQQVRQWKSLINHLPADLRGQTAVLVGWGPIAQRLAFFLHHLGVRCIALRFSEATHSSEIVHFFPISAIDALLPTADWLILACPLTTQTRGLIDAQRLARLPQHARFINIARGEVVDEDALIDALENKQLAGAYLDVFTTEPLATASPLWHLENVIVTPHSAGHAAGNEARVVELFLSNLERKQRNDPLLNLVL